MQNGSALVDRLSQGFKQKLLLKYLQASKCVNNGDSSIAVCVTVVLEVSLSLCMQAIFLQSLTTS